MSLCQYTCPTYSRGPWPPPNACIQAPGCLCDPSCFCLFCCFVAFSCFCFLCLCLVAFVVVLCLFRLRFLFLVVCFFLLLFLLLLFFFRWCCCFLFVVFVFLCFVFVLFLVFVLFAFVCFGCSVLFFFLLVSLLVVLLDCSLASCCACVVLFAPHQHTRRRWFVFTTFSLGFPGWAPPIKGCREGSCKGLARLAWGPLGLQKCLARALLAILGRSWEPLLGILGRSWGLCWRSGAALGAFVGDLGLLLGAFGGDLGPSWEPLLAILGRLGGLCWRSWTGSVQLFFRSSSLRVHGVGAGFGARLPEFSQPSA